MQGNTGRGRRGRKEGEVKGKRIVMGEFTSLFYGFRKEFMFTLLSFPCFMKLQRSLRGPFFTIFSQSFH